MDRLRVCRIVCVVVGLVTLAFAAQADESKANQEAGAKTEAPATARPAQPEAAAPRKRSVQQVRNCAAEDLAKVLSQHFQSDTGVQIIAEPRTNSLLINAGPAAFDEIVQTLAILDRPLQPISLEVLVVELATPNDNEGKPAGDTARIDDKQFVGPIGEVNARVEAMEAKGRIISLKRMRMPTLEHQKANTLSGEEKIAVRSVLVNQRTGGATPITEARSAGTSVQVTPRITARKELLLDLAVSDERLIIPADGPVLGKSEQGPIVAHEPVSLTVQTKLCMAPGHAAVAHGVETDTRPQANRFVVIVMAEWGDDATDK